MSQHKRKEELFALANRHHQAGQLADAERLYQEVLALDSRHADSLHLSGVIAYQTGRYDLAVSLIGKAIGVSGQIASFHSNLGNVLQDQGKLEEAAFSYRRALAFKPDYAQAHNNIGNVFKKQERQEEAMAAYRRALVLNAGFADAHNNLGNILWSQGHFSEAAKYFGRALGLRPDYAEAHNNLGLALHDQDMLEQADMSYETALALRPDFAEAHGNRGSTLQHLDKLEPAIASYLRALTIAPHDAEARSNLASVYQQQGKTERAITHYRRALALSPEHAIVYGNLGTFYGELGRAADMLHLIERAITISPRKGNFYQGLANCRRFTEGDPKITVMQKLLAETTGLTDEDRTYLQLALGKAFDDLGQYAQAFEHFLAGNALHRRRIRYDEDETLGLLDRIGLVFTRELLDKRRASLLTESTIAPPLPIFVLGMPRSGTTLIEQILASHPQVYGAGELPAFRDSLNDFRPRPGLPAKFPEIIPALNDDELASIGEAYLARLRAMPSDAPYMTDKMPANFRFVGLIHLILPQAKIIHARRDPIDTCLSCFTKRFAGDQPFAYDLAELGRYWRGYDRLMTHWHDVLPDDALLDIAYEEVVADLETQARRIIAFCGLDWDPACLSFHKTARPVRTASSAQVRQPIYKNAVGRWQGYGEALDPLRTALKG